MSTAALPPVPTGIPPSARPGVPVDKRVTLPHLHADNHIRMMHVYPQVGKLLQQMVAHLSGDLWRFVGETACRCAYSTLKVEAVSSSSDKVLPPPAGRWQRDLFAHTRPGIAHHAEHLGNALFRQVQVGSGILGST